MPDFVIEVTSKRIFGPFVFKSASEVRNAIVRGDLRMDETEIEDNSPVTFKVKEVKPEK